MKVLNMSLKKFEKLEQFVLPRNIMNTEAKLFVLEDKEKWINKNI